MKKLLMLTLLLTLSLVLVACGSSEEPAANENANDTAPTESNEAPATDNAGEASTDAANAVTIKASNWEFDQEVYEVAAGTVTVNLENVDGHHGIMVLGTDVSINGNGEATAELEPGEYDIICSIPCGTGHAEMAAKLVVK